MLLASTDLGWCLASYPVSLVESRARLSTRETGNGTRARVVFGVSSSLVRSLLNVTVRYHLELEFVEYPDLQSMCLLILVMGVCTCYVGMYLLCGYVLAMWVCTCYVGMYLLCGYVLAIVCMDLLVVDAIGHMYWPMLYYQGTSPPTVCRKLFMEIRCSDGSLMPQRVQVRAGKQHSDFTDLSTVSTTHTCIYPRIPKTTYY